MWAECNITDIIGRCGLPGNSISQAKQAETPSDGPPVIRINADSDSLIVKGLIAVLLALFDGRTPQEILDLDPEQVFDQLGLRQHLSGQRRNGLYAMVQRIKTLAALAA